MRPDGPVLASDVERLLQLRSQAVLLGSWFLSEAMIPRPLRGSRRRPREAAMDAKNAESGFCNCQLEGNSRPSRAVSNGRAQAAPARFGLGPGRRR